jgi:hypothetical protein
MVHQGFKDSDEDGLDGWGLDELLYIDMKRSARMDI